MWCISTIQFTESINVTILFKKMSNKKILLGMIVLVLSILLTTLVYSGKRCNCDNNPSVKTYIVYNKPTETFIVDNREIPIVNDGFKMDRYVVGVKGDCPTLDKKFELTKKWQKKTQEEGKQRQWRRLKSKHHFGFKDSEHANFVN
jgi:hypothetical protein